MGDDAIGIEIVNSIIKSNINTCAQVLFYISFEILDKITTYDNVIIVDAADVGWQYGEYNLLNYNNISENMYIKNSHGISLFHVLKIGYEVFNNMPTNLYILLIQTGKINDFKKNIDQKLILRIPHIINKIDSIFKKNK